MRLSTFMFIFKAADYYKSPIEILLENGMILSIIKDEFKDPGNF